MCTMMRKWSFIVSLTMVLLLLFGGVASAFDDLPDGADRDKIRALKERGIVNGYGSSYMGQKKMSNAEAVHLIVKGMELSLAKFLFIKAPVASDYFDTVPNDAWYSESFVIASVNGLQLPRTIDPKEPMTREAFAHHLLTALLTRGDYPFTKMLVSVTDEADVSPDYRHSLQLLLNAKIATLDKDGKFHPKDAITRRDAAVLVYNTLEFIKAHEEPIPDDGITVDEKVTVDTTKVTDDVNKVTISWGEKPHGGYSITITKVDFEIEGKATVYYKLHYPKKGEMYTQAITNPKADTYVSSKLKVIAVQEK